MFTKHYDIPDWLYEAFPYSYFVAGLVVLTQIDNRWALFSGVLLLLAGTMVLAMRYHFRRHAQQDDQGDLNKIVQINSKENGSLQLVWDQRFESGNHGIDSQHKRLFKIGNALIDSVYGRQTKEEVALILDQLIVDATTHFTSEEALLESWDYIHLERHKQIHQDLLNDAYSLREAVDSDQLRYKDVLNFFINDLVINHILKEDKKYFLEI